MNHLGVALSINSESVRVYSESFIRSHLMFQVSKALEQLTSLIKRELKLPPFTIISMRPATGIVCKVKSIYDAIG